MRNKAKGFPNQVNHKFEGEPGATDAYALNGRMVKRIHVHRNV